MVDTVLDGHLLGIRYLQDAMALLLEDGQFPVTYLAAGRSVDILRLKLRAQSQLWV